MKKNNKMKIYIAIIPCDYNTADVEIFKYKEDAEKYIAENKGKWSKGYVLERDI